jgi:hypothetical protein
MKTLTLPEELASLFRYVHNQEPQNEDEMTQADIYSIIVRIFTHAADHGRAITLLSPLWEELEPAIDRKSS